jgi:hypothetical protein
MYPASGREWTPHIAGRRWRFPHNSRKPRAAADGNLALMECNDAVTGEPRYVICAVGRDGTDFVFAPFGHLADGNPFDAYLPPSDPLTDPSTS